MNVDHATGEIGGKVVRSLLKVPLSRSLERFGSLPSFIKRSASSGSMPSNPKITARSNVALGIGTAGETARSSTRKTNRGTQQKSPRTTTVPQIPPPDRRKHEQAQA